MEDTLNDKKNFLETLETKKNFAWIILAFFIGIGCYIRTRNISLLKDVTTGGYILPDLDPFVFLRYARYIVEHGTLMSWDTMRYYPIGMNPWGEYGFLSFVLAYLYNFLHLFSSSVTIEYSTILYPVIAFAFGILFFYLLVKELFDWKIALLSSAFLVVLPPYLYRTMAGVADKEPLGMMFIFAIMYLMVKAWKIENWKKAVSLASVAGILTGMLGAIWGGVTSIFLIFGAFVLVEVILGKFKNKDYYVYWVWFILAVFFLNLFYSERFSLSGILFSLTSGLMTFAFLLSIIDYLIRRYNPFNFKIRFKLPIGFLSLIISSIFSFIIMIFVFGFNFLISWINSIFVNLVNPFGQTRWALTVAESHQPYLIDVITQFTPVYFWLFLIAIGYFAYVLFKDLKYKWYILTIYSLSMFLFIFSRYKPNFMLDGESVLSHLVFFGSLIVLILGFFGFYLWCYFKEKEVYNQILTFSKSYTFVFVWLIFMIISARSAIRFLMLLAPISAVLFAFLIVGLLTYLIVKMRDNKYKNYAKVGLVILLILLVWPFGSFIGEIPVLKSVPLINTDGVWFGHYNLVLAQANGVGLPYNTQWQYAMKWVRENTSKEAIFAHWWDYGYWVQTGAGRATLGDGGNARGAINHFLGRYLMTSNNDQETLEFLKSNKATNILMIADDIGKYPAFSSIGSDKNYDRYSWIMPFVFDQKLTSETKENIVFGYRGAWVLDQDVIFNNVLFPKQAAAIGAIAVVFDKDFNVSLNQSPIVIILNGGQQMNVPVKCLYYDSKRYDYDVQGLDGCVVIVPAVEGQNINKLGSATYLSKRVADGFFGKYYFLNQQSPYFSLVYSDGNQNAPIVYYNGQFVGPLRIWKINYPDNVKDNPILRGTTLPDPSVDNV